MHNQPIGLSPVAGMIGKCSYSPSAGTRIYLEALVSPLNWSIDLPGNARAPSHLVRDRFVLTNSTLPREMGKVIRDFEHRSRGEIFDHAYQLS